MDKQPYTGQVYDTPPSRQPYTGKVFNTNPLETKPEDVRPEGGPAVPGTMSPEERAKSAQEVQQKKEHELPKWLYDSGDLEGTWVDSNVLKPIATGLANTPSNIRRSGAAIMETVTGGVGTEGLTERTYKNTPMYENPDAGVVGQAVQTMTEAAPGLVVGGGIATRLLPVAKGTISAIGRYLAVNSAGDVGASFTMNENEKRLLVGEDSTLNLLKGVGEDSQGNFREEVFDKKMNLLYDNLATGLGTSVAFGTVGKILKSYIIGPQIKNISTWASKSKKEDAVMKDLILAVSDIPENATPRQMQEATNKLINIIQSNKDDIIKLSEIHPDAPDVNIKNSPMETIANLFRDKASKARLTAEGDALNAAAIKFEEAVRAHAGPKVQAAMDAPVRRATDSLDVISESYGGPEAVAKGGKSLVEEMDSALVQPKRDAVDTLNKNRQKDLKNLQKRITKDPLFQGTSDNVTSLDDRVLDDATSLTKDITDAGKKVTETKQAKYAAIKDGTIGDPTIYEPAIKSLSESKDQNLKNIAKAIEATGGDIKKLDEVALDLKGLTQGYSNPNNPNYNPTLAAKLKQLRTDITSKQLDAAIEKGVDPVNVAAIQEAKRYFKEEVTPWRDNPVLKGMMNEQTKLQSPTVKNVESRKILSEGFNQAYKEGGAGSREYIQEAMRIVDNSGFSDDIKGKFTKHALLRVSEGLEKSIQMKGEVDPSIVRGAVAMLRKARPFMHHQTAAKYERTLTELLETGVTDAKQFNKLLAEAEKELGDTEGLYNTILKDFLGPQGMKGSSSESFEAFWKNTDSVNNLNTILEKTGNNPVIVDALKASYAKSVKNQLINKTSGKVAAGAVDTFLDVNSSMALNARKLYGDEGYDVLAKLVKGASDASDLSTGRRRAIVEPSKQQKNFRVAVQTVLTWMFGVLNPTAARIRTITSQYGADNTVTPEIKDIIDTVFADPDAFIRIAERVKNQSVSTVDRTTKMMLRRALVKGGVYSSTDEDKTLNDMELKMDQK